MSVDLEELRYLGEALSDQQVGLVRDGIRPATELLFLVVDSSEIHRSVFSLGES